MDKTFEMLKGRKFYRSLIEGTSKGGSSSFSMPGKEYPSQLANLVTSESALHPGTHLPVLDLDVPAWLVPSSTPGHSHLYINVKMSWEQYQILLIALAQAGIIEENYMRHSLSHGRTYVRKPGITKDNEREFLERTLEGFLQGLGE